MGGQRINYLSREASRLAAQGSTREQILLRLRAYNETRCSPPLPDEEIIQIAHVRLEPELEPDLIPTVFPVPTVFPAPPAFVERSPPPPPPELPELVRFRPAELPEPQPLRAPRQPVSTSYPLPALGLVLGAAARRIHQVVQAPAALCGQSLLAAASLAAQALADVEMDGRRETLSLYAFSVGDLAEGKGPVDRIALTAHREHERQVLERLRQEQQAYQIARQAHAAARRQACRGKDPALIHQALQALGPAPLPPEGGIFLVPAASAEALLQLYEDGRGSIGLFQDDARGLLGGAQEARRKRMGELSRLWDSGEIGRGRTKYFGRRLALHGLLPLEFATQLCAEAPRSGMGPRALLAWPAAPVGERPYVEEDLSVDPALTRYHERIRALLACAQGNGELSPRTLTLDGPARRAWIEAHDALQGRREQGALRAWLAKAPSQILRIAGVLTLVEDPQARVIRAAAVEQGAALVQHHLDEVARLIAHTTVPEEVRAAEALRDWCHRQGIRLLHSAEALQYGPRCVRRPGTFDAAIRVLERKGWASRIQGDCMIDGRRRRRAWHIVAPRPEVAEGKSLPGAARTGVPFNWEPRS